jgi:hypothetical protein
VSASESAEEYIRCPVCDLLVQEAERETWLFVEITRYTSAGLPGWTYRGFCSQAHASQWLAQPLPVFEPVTVMPRTAKDRLSDIGLMAMFAIPALLAMVGIVAILAWAGLFD